MFLFPQAKKQKNKPAPEDFWECDVSIATLTRRIHCKYDKFYLKYGRGFIQFSIIIVLLLFNQSCSAEGEDKKYIYITSKNGRNEVREHIELACQYWLTNDFTHNVV